MPHLVLYELCLLHCTNVASGVFGTVYNGSDQGFVKFLSWCPLEFVDCQSMKCNMPWSEIELEQYKSGSTKHLILGTRPGH